MRAVQGRRSHRCVRPRNARNASGVVDYRRAAPFRALAREVGESAAAPAHRYALSIPGVATVILGVKNRTELRECLAAAERGPLDPRLVARIDAAVKPE